MDRNGSFDYRNFFYPGPAPLPVQIYPVNRDPRFPFINMDPRGDSVSPAAATAAAADVDDDHHAPVSSPHPAGGTSGSMIARRDAAAAAPPAKLEHVLQELSHLLAEATKFCEECLKTHGEVVGVATFAGHATRNTLWRELVDSRLEDNGVHKDLLDTLVTRVRRYTSQAQQAVHHRGRAEGKDANYKLALLADKLSSSCDMVGRMNSKARASSAACEVMVDSMREMRELCGKMAPGAVEGAAAQDGQEGGGGQY